MKTSSEPQGYRWCDRKECWIHWDVCRFKAYQKATRRCLVCLQLSLFPPLAEFSTVQLQLDKIQG